MNSKLPIVGRYQITNTLGQQLLSGEIMESIDVSSLKEGVYFLSFFDGNNRVYHTRFVKH